ncbi:hypothetical protein [Pseudomonas fluorescens]|uniref:NlpC/P60 domain-containing protein n=1 Tax=Pseudomonas fluorescens TaxID=294 RepID=A0A5E7BC79_PSEFL|nr:hypothetical protein [Pseudomonas fluorescens]VVN83701.1 hypothetical protein PS704_01300 [Pseudomonas fluorescens]
MEWVNHYLRSTYVDGARGPSQYDCWGLVREARHLHCGKALLPSFGAVRNTRPRLFTEAYLHEASAMVACDPEHGAIAAVMHGRICVHVALVVEVEGYLRILEINQVRGARFTPLANWQRDHLTVTFHRDPQ